jgi:selenocysteine-specific elongation factor
MRSVVVGTAGHIDHGKSALVQGLTGTDPDRLKEEKARGITIDLGFAYAAGEVGLAFVDVPGHERFVKNMLAGVGGIDIVLLVIAADESVMPQTREHFEICRLLRVPAGVVALTKTDLADQETLEVATLEVTQLVAGSFLEGAPIVPVSSRTGEGLDVLHRELMRAAALVDPRATDGPARLPIDRVFTMRGFGTVVTGTLLTGSITTGDSLAVLPQRGSVRAVTVRGLQVHGVTQTQAVAGERTAVNLQGVDVHGLSRGQVLAGSGTLTATNVLDAALEILPSAKPLRDGARVRFHQGTAEIIGRVGLLGSGAQTLADTGYVRIRLEQPAVVTRGDRFILRTYSPPVTMAGGTVLDPTPPRLSLKRATSQTRFERLDIENENVLEVATSAAAIMVDESSGAGFPVADLVSRVGATPREARSIQAALTMAGRAEQIEDVLVAPRVLEELKHAVLDRLTAHHRADRLSDGAPREEVRQQLFRRGHPAVFARAIEDLAQAGLIAARDRLALATHRAELSPEEARVRTSIENVLRGGGLTPPDVTGVTLAVGATREVVDRVVRLLEREKQITRLGSLLFDQDALEGLKAQIRSLKTDGKAAVTLDVTAFKERFGVTRKFAIPLLEYLDREHVTRRIGNSRTVL